MHTYYDVADLMETYSMPFEMKSAPIWFCGKALKYVQLHVHVHVHVTPGRIRNPCNVIMFCQRNTQILFAPI